MRQLYYTLQTLIRGKGSNLIKIVSLGLGLAVSILIFSRQAFELNYDTCYKDHERLCLVKTVWYYNNEYHPSHITLGPVAGTIAENLPDEVESVTVTQQWWSNSAWFANERRFQTNAMTADSCFFATMGIDVVSGDPRELNNPEVVFISRELAGSMFADKNPIGQTVVYNKQMPMTVKGIFEDFLAGRFSWRAGSLVYRRCLDRAVCGGSGFWYLRILAYCMHCTIAHHRLCSIQGMADCQ